MITALTGIHFGTALVKHFGLEGSQVSSDMTLHTKGDDIFGVTLTIMLDGADLEAIGKIMQGKNEPDEWAAPFAVAKEMAAMRDDYRPANARRAHGVAPAHAPAQPMADSIEKAKP